MSTSEIVGTIEKYLRIRVKTYKDIVKNTDISQSTYFRRMSNPEQFTLSELKQIFNYLRIPNEERRF